MELKRVLAETIRAHFPEADVPITLDVKKERDDFDYSSPVVFALAKKVGKSPVSVAETLVGALKEKLEPDIEVFTIAGAPPFINFRLTPAAWAKTLKSLQDSEHHFSAEPLYKDRRVLVEFLSANPTGPSTLGNGRGGFCGDALANVYAFAGAEVEREYYVNNAGNQILELGKSIIAAKQGKSHEGGYQGEYIKELANTVHGTDPAKVGAEAAQRILDEWIKPATERMGVHFDRFFSEIELAQSGAVDEMEEILTEHELVYEEEGAVWLRTTHLGDDKDRVIRRSDGTPTYLLTDIAYHWDKMQRGFTTMVTMIGADHFTEAQTLEMVVRHVLVPLNKRPVEFHQPMYQFVRLIENGQEVKMSKRAGTFVTLDDLLDRIDPDVARFFFVWNAYSNQMDFDLTLAKEASDQNPVYYIQYAYVRAKHILEHEKAEGLVVDLPSEITLNPDERRLLLHLREFPTIIENILHTTEVHYLAHYAIELARLFHTFYAVHPVLKAEEAVRPQRLALTHATFALLQQGLSLIGVSQPEKMVQPASNG